MSAINWIEPIYDRTPADVSRAKLQVQEWIKKMANGEEVTITDLKGYLNAIDLNRIENDVEYLSMYSSLSLTVKTNWSRADLPNQTAISRIINNINRLISNFGLSQFTYEMPTTILTYSHVNTIEHNLQIIKNLLEDVTMRIKALFDKVDLGAEMNVTITLSIPFGSALDNFDIATDIATHNSAGIPLKKEFGDIDLIMSSKVINSKTFGIKFEPKIKVDLSGIVHNFNSNPIISSDWLNMVNLAAKLYNKDSVPMKADASMVTFGLSALFAELAPTEMKLVGAIATSLITETIAYVAKTSIVKLQTTTEVGMISASMNFADMFLEALFGEIAEDMTAQPIVSVTYSVNGKVNTAVSTDMTVKLYGKATLSDIDNLTLADVDEENLKELDYHREITNL